MAKLLDRALTPDAINRAWKSVRNDRAPWRVGMSRTEMERNLATHLLRLVDDLRQGRYRPDAMRQFTIAKGDGRQRVLSALTLRDKLAQRAVLSVLDPIGEQLFHHDSFGYRPGRNVDMALARVRERVRCGLPWLVDADIRGFFDNIPHRPLRKALARVVPDREVLRLVDQWLEVGTYQTGILTGPRGIPQGAVISPFLCNVYLHQLDGRHAQSGVPFVRYADDFLLFAPDEPTAAKALKLVSGYLRDLDLEIHPEKTRVVRSGPQVSFLGQPLPAPP
jgi:RNA-directed DNA polymerase